MYYTPESEGRAPEAELRPLKWTLLEDTAPRADPQRKLHRLAAALSTLAGTHAALASCKGGVTSYTRRAGRARRQRKPARKTFVWARPVRHFVDSPAVHVLRRVLSDPSTSWRAKKYLSGGRRWGQDNHGDCHGRNLGACGSLIWSRPPGRVRFQAGAPCVERDGDGGTVVERREEVRLLEVGNGRKSESTVGEREREHGRRNATSLWRGGRGGLPLPGPGGQPEQAGGLLEWWVAASRGCEPWC